MSAEPIQNRFTFPHPDDKEVALMWRIVRLMLDGKRRSKVEICDALDIDRSTEVRARIQDAKKAERGAWPFIEIPWPFETLQFGDVRAEGPDPDHVYRYQLKPRPVAVTDAMQGREIES